MKNIIKLIGLTCLVCFSFFYTEKVIDVVNEQDEIMIKLNKIKDNFGYKKIEAIINDDTIIPGIVGKEIDIDASYKEMKQVGIYKEMLLKYKDIELANKIENNLDKYIIKGNNEKKQISLITIIDSNYKLNLIDKIDYVNLNLFVDYNIISNNISKLKKNNFNIYNFANNGIYNKDIIIYTNNLIEKNYNKSQYCLALNKNKDTLDICSNSQMNTIIPNININNNLYKEIKNNLNKGNIIKIEVNNKNISELKLASEFIKSKGYKIVFLDDLLNEY